MTPTYKLKFARHSKTGGKRMIRCFCRCHSDTPGVTVYGCTRCLKKPVTAYERLDSMTPEELDRCRVTARDVALSIPRRRFR